MYEQSGKCDRIVRTFLVFLICFLFIDIFQYLLLQKDIFEMRVYITYKARHMSTFNFEYNITVEKIVKVN